MQLPSYPYSFGSESYIPFLPSVHDYNNPAEPELDMSSSSESVSFEDYTAMSHDQLLSHLQARIEEARLLESSLDRIENEIQFMQCLIAERQVQEIKRRELTYQTQSASYSSNVQEKPPSMHVPIKIPSSIYSPICPYVEPLTPPAVENVKSSSMQQINPTPIKVTINQTVSVEVKGPNRRWCGGRSSVGPKSNPTKRPYYQQIPSSDPSVSATNSFLQKAFQQAALTIHQNDVGNPPVKEPPTKKSKPWKDQVVVFSLDKKRSFNH